MAGKKAKKKAKVVSKSKTLKTAKRGPKPGKRKPLANTGVRSFEKVSKVRTKSEVIKAVSDNTGLSRKEIAGVLETFSELIQFDLKGPGAFTVPGLMKIKVKRKRATKARKGVSPFTGEAMVFKAKPARNVIKILPLKALKSMV